MKKTQSLFIWPFLSTETITFSVIVFQLISSTSLRNNLFSVCASMCLCLLYVLGGPTHACGCSHSCGHKKTMSGVFSSRSLYDFIEIAWLAINVLGSPFLCPSVLRLQAHRTMFSFIKIWVLEICTQVLLFLQQVFSPTEQTGILTAGMGKTGDGESS